MARGATVQRLGQNGQPRRYAQNVQLVAGFLDDGFSAARLRRRQENPVGGAGDIFVRPEHSDVSFHLIVVGRYVFVGDRPIVALTVMGTDFEVDGRHAESNASPVIRAATDDARTK